MSWNEQMEQATKAWTDLQRTWWERWMPAAGETAGTGDGLWSQWLEGWRRQMARSLETWARGRPGLPPQVVRSLFAGEEVFFRFVAFVSQMLQSLAPQIEAGEDWVDLLRRYVDQIKKDLEENPLRWLPTAQGTATVAAELPGLWRLWATEAQKMMAPWMESTREAGGHLGEAMAGDRRAVLKMMNVFWDTYESTLGRFLAAPAIGYTREFQEKAARAYETWVDVQRAQAEFQAEVTNAGVRAMETLLRELVERAEKGKPVTSARQLFDLWVSCAEKAYFEVASTESFAEIQGRFVNAAMHYRVHERQIVEAFARTLHLPTRTELDDAYRHMHELRREVKALRRELDALREARAAQETGPKKPTVGARRRGRAKAAGAGKTTANEAQTEPTAPAEAGPKQEG